MASSLTSKAIPSQFDSQVQGGSPRRAHSWFLRALDSLLSEELRKSVPSDLARCRVLAGSSCILLLFALVGLVAFPSPVLKVVMALIFLGYGTALVLLRRATSHVLPALMLCSASVVGGGALLFCMRGLPYFGTHAGLMLQPALAVYLLGRRRGFIIALIWAGEGLLYPLYYTRFGAGAGASPDELLWPLYLCASFSFISAWGLGALHNAARAEAQSTLEHTLKELRASESQLLSLIESTEDLVFSLDAEGRLLTFNSAARQVYAERFGRKLLAGQPLFSESDPELLAAWQAQLAGPLAGQRTRYEEAYALQGTPYTFDISVNPVHGTEGRVTGVTVFARNISARKDAEFRMGEMYRTLVDVSRQAGMAEIATGVLHNVGNTLNSVNVSTTLVIDQLSQSRLPGLARVSELVQAHSKELASFLTQDPQGQVLPEYLAALSEQLQKEHRLMLKEMSALSASVDHIKAVVSMQQKYARVAGALEEVYVPQLIDEALRLHAISFERLGIRIERNYASVPSLLVDRHRLLQILVNLLSNARDALITSGVEGKRLIIDIHLSPDNKVLLLRMTDNGVGIAAENLPRLFTQGFTTKKSGHGFGLHSSALAALEMQGKLSCASPGLGEGATFTLELPVEGAKSMEGISKPLVAAREATA